MTRFSSWKWIEVEIVLFFYIAGNEYFKEKLSFLFVVCTAWSKFGTDTHFCTRTYS